MTTAITTIRFRYSAPNSTTEFIGEASIEPDFEKCGYVATLIRVFENGMPVGLDMLTTQERFGCINAAEQRAATYDESTITLPTDYEAKIVVGELVSENCAFYIETEREIPARLPEEIRSIRGGKNPHRYIVHAACSQAKAVQVLAAIL